MPEPTCTVTVPAGVCGHAEDQHEDVTLTLTLCHGCVPVGVQFFTWHRDAPNEQHAGAHAFTTEPEEE